MTKKVVGHLYCVTVHHFKQRRRTDDDCYGNEEAERKEMERKKKRVERERLCEERGRGGRQGEEKKGSSLAVAAGS
jgi:hypothetical protein